MQQGLVAGGFRRRLTIAFLLVAGVAAAAVGLGAYLLVRDTRSDDFVDRSLSDAEANYLTLEERGASLGETELMSLTNRFEQRTADATIVTTPQGSFASSPTISPDDIPDELSEPEAYEENTPLPHADVTVSGSRYFVVGTPETPWGTRMHFFYSKAGLEAGLQDLAGITWRLWLIVVIGAALVGNALARRTLKPVSRAGTAARSLAEGLLDTRLPIEREDEFGAWALSFNEMAQALEVKISELVAARDRERQFTSDVSHELRTPLTSLVTSASMLELNLDQMEPEMRWLSERMIAEARRVRDLADELLEMSRLHSGRETVTMSRVDLGQLVENVISNQNWKQIVEFHPQTVMVCTDKARMERIVVNLMSNAVEHGKENPRVAVGSNGESAFVEVCDEGPGIPSNHLTHIFERFYKADSARAGGSGLGLSIAAENARLLGATIDVRSTQGVGTTFTLRLPTEVSTDASDDAAD